jgi:hypothetical protein
MWGFNGTDAAIATPLSGWIFPVFGVLASAISQALGKVKTHQLGY